MDRNISLQFGCRKEIFIKSVMFCEEIGRRVEAYEIREGVLIAYWHYDTKWKYDERKNNIIPLPYKMDMEQWSEFAWGWLLNQDIDTNRGGDGSWVRAFNLHCTDFISMPVKEVDSEGIPKYPIVIDYAFMTIEPTAIYISK